MKSVKRVRTFTSPLWQFFKRLGPGNAKCCICKNIFSYKSSNTNLKRHLIARHFHVFDKIWGKHSSMENERMRVRNLIANVKMHPCLWDTRCNSYGNEQLQEEAWNQIASELYPQEEASQFVQKISEQFTTLKTKFLTNHLCSYSNELSFMAPLRCGNIEDILLYTDADNMQTEEESIGNKDGLRLGNKKCSKRWNKNQGRQSNRTECNVQLNKADGDTLFLLSLADEFRKVPEECQMNFKAEFLMKFNKHVEKYRKMSK